MKRYYIFDNPNDKHSLSFIDCAGCFETIYPETKIISLKSQIKYIRHILSVTENGDTLVFWYDFLGVLCSTLLKKREKRNIVILNILLKKKRTIKNRLARFLYRKSLKKPFVLATVSSQEYAVFLNSLFKRDFEYQLLMDPYHGNLGDGQDGNYCFCGGRNGRDWDLAIKIARQLPNLVFHFVMSDTDYDKYSKMVEGNVILRKNISLDEFDEEIKNCSFLTMPLNTEAPAGILVFYQAASYGKAIVTSDTVVTRNYFGSNRGVLCSSLENWMEKISFLKQNPQQRKQYSDNFRLFLNNECSEKRYIERVLNVCEVIENAN